MLNLPKLGEVQFQQLQRLMQDASGIHLASNKRTLVAGRLMRRLRHFQLSNYDQYLAMIADPAHQRERRLVIDLLTTNETYFFREHPHFEFLGQWLAQQRGPVRMWSAACSSGEEPYSLAMVAAEHLSGDWSVTASDLSQSMLAVAERGIYSMEQSRYFPEGWLRRYAQCGVGEMEGRLRIQANLRARVRFREVNVIRPLPEDLGTFDVIFLRNLLIYFDAAQKQEIVRRMVGQLRVGGMLFIGHAESIHGFNLPLRLAQPSVFERV
ncbi:MAG: protein-glutamate O-methyltransferase CheR [Pseudomonas farsensis]|uniref:CheR family methyltransferase n=1 Tax=Pseudomonas farsensis TaxID=2745492 RepID=UPI003C7C72C1